MTQNNKPADDIDFIEVIEPVLDNTQFLVALAGGIVLGAIAYYAYLEYQKTQSEKAATPEPVQYIDDENAPDESSERRSGVPEWAGQG